MNFLDKNEVLRKTQELQEYRKRLRNHERGLNARIRALGSMPEVGASDLKNFESSIQQFLPASHMPGNIGPIGAVVWPFWASVDFDFGNDPTMSTNLRQTQNFQVSQEAGYMIMAISRDSSQVSLAGSLGPWQLIVRDAQSSRQLNNNPVPFQTIGSNSQWSILPTPYFLFPNARFEVEMSAFNDTPFVAVGEAVHQISFFGYRMRVEDAQNVLSQIFGG